MPSFIQFLGHFQNLDVRSLSEFSLPAIFALIIIATFVTEDGACLAAGALAGQGRIGLLFAVSACFAGILIGDVGLYLIGAASGKRVRKTILFKRFVSRSSLRTASYWLEKRGVAAIFISRFVPGLRLPTYLAAGFLRTNFLKFLFYFIVAALIWTPLVVISAAYAQKLVPPEYVFGTVIALYFLIHLGLNLTTWKRRRILLGRIKRWTKWEFWPLWLFYAPVFVYVLVLGIKNRSLTVFTSANPSIIGGGFVGESKSSIYEDLGRSGENVDFLLKHHLIQANPDIEKSLKDVRIWLSKHSLDYPFAAKPDTGERGKAVQIVRNETELAEYLDEGESASVLQEFAPGVEISVFYFRFPSKEKGQIFSVTDKSFPHVTGDGENTLEHLILSDPRAICLAQKYLDQNTDRLDEIPAVGQQVQIIEIGTHSRGAVFSDGAEFITPELESAIDGIVQEYDGFYFGRFDLRANSEDDFRNGRNFKIIELNGVTSESTNIYDPRFSLLDAYSILFRQWRIAFEIGMENKANGHKPTGFFDLVKLLFGFTVHRNPDS